MPNPYFRFKQFTVYHDRCAMKVGTDGVLLGSWADVNKAENIIDVGTGSGLIALMVAQRNKNAKIIGIDSDVDAVVQAGENVLNSPFSARIQIEKIPFLNFVTSTIKKFDQIISNPPYFLSSLKSIDEKRSLARHANDLSVVNLFSFSKKIISEKGRLSFICPYGYLSLLERELNNQHWFIHRKTIVYPYRLNTPKRVLMELALFPPTDGIKITDLIIEKSRHVYSEHFSNLVKDFYLHL